MLSLGSTEGIRQHVLTREPRSFQWFRDLFMFGGDHKPTKLDDGTEIYLTDGKGNATENILRDSWGRKIHNVRVGEGWHFHNISDAFTFFHQDAGAPTTIRGAFHHLGEWSASAFGGLLNKIGVSGDGNTGSITIEVRQNEAEVSVD